MGGFVMIEGQRARLHQAIQSLSEHQLVVTPSRDGNGYVIKEGKTIIEVSVDSDEDSVIFLTFSWWNAFRWISASRLICRVQEMIKSSLSQH